MNDGAIEREIQAKGLTAPRVTPADIEANIAEEHYFTAAEGVSGAGYVIHNANVRGPMALLTFCVLVLRNGFTVTGESACASPENFDAEVGRNIARQNAVNKIWPLMGYALKEALSKKQARSLDTQDMNFGQAIALAREGYRVQRAGWNGKGMWVELQTPDTHSKMTLPYLYLNYPDNAHNTPGARVPWLASQTDMLSNDWQIV